MRSKNRLFVVVLFTLSIVSCKKTETTGEMGFDILANTTILSNIEYKKYGDSSLFLDIYLPSSKFGEEPWHKPAIGIDTVIINFHGGGWFLGDRNQSVLSLLPFMGKNITIVNVDYRLIGKGNTFTEMIEDCIDAVNYIVSKSEHFGFGTRHIILMGDSAGGHLALLTAMINTDGIKELGITSKKKYAVDGVINWYGISDIRSAIDFWGDIEYENMIRHNQNNQNFFDLISPINHVEKGSPRVVSIHGSKDINVPIDQSIILHEKLSNNGVSNLLLKIDGKKHGNFDSGEYADTYKSIFEFLAIDDE